MPNNSAFLRTKQRRALVDHLREAGAPNPLEAVQVFDDRLKQFAPELVPALKANTLAIQRCSNLRFVQTLLDGEIVDECEGNHKDINLRRKLQKGANKAFIKGIDRTWYSCKPIDRKFRQLCAELTTIWEENTGTRLPPIKISTDPFAISSSALRHPLWLALDAIGLYLDEPSMRDIVAMLDVVMIESNRPQHQSKQRARPAKMQPLLKPRRRIFTEDSIITF